MITTIRTHVTAIQVITILLCFISMLNSGYNKYNISILIVSNIFIIIYLLLFYKDNTITLKQLKNFLVLLVSVMYVLVNITVYFLIDKELAIWFLTTPVLAIIAAVTFFKITKL